MFASIPVAYVMNKVSNSVFGGVSGDMIGATNEVARAVVAGFVCGGADSNMKVPALVMAGGKGSSDGFVNREAAVAVSG